MKKFVLFFAGIACAAISHAQLILNEIYVRPNTNQGHQEYFELKNTSPIDENTACYSLVAYFKNDAGERGFYKIDMPAATVAAGGFYVGSTSAPSFQFQNGAAQSDFDWNSGHINRYVYTNGSLVMNNAGAPYYDVFIKSTGSNNGNSGLYGVFLFKGTELVDAFLGANNSITVPDYITELGMLNGTGGCGAYSYDFTNINNEEDSLFGYVIPSAGTDNGYYRVPVGCGSDGQWEKASSPSEHTPHMENVATNNGGGGGSNGGGNGNGGTITPLEVNTECLNDTTISYDITAGSNKLFPVKVYVYYDANGSQFIDAGDVLIATYREHNANGGARMIHHASGQEDFIFVFDAKGSCNDLVVPLNCPAAIILPVTLQSFTLHRSGTNVVLNWTTVTETNNRGFYVQRLQGNGEWQNLTFIPSAAAGGNSTRTLNYTHSDFNNFKGVTQYRLKQVDIDGRSKFSDIRSVRGEAAATSGIVLYPNPGYGTVNLQFSDANSQRDVLITDMSGRVVRQFRSITSQNLQLSGLTPGVYSVKVIDAREGSQQTERLVISGR